MDRQQLAHFIGARLVDGKPHEHPANDHRRPQGHHHELVGHTVHHRHLAALRLGGQAGHHGTQGGRQLLHGVRQTDGAQLQVRAQQGRHGGADATAMVFQHRLDGFTVLRVHGRAKAIVGGQQGRALAQLLGVLLQQALPDVLVQVQRARDLGACIAVDGRTHHRKACGLHDQQQQQRQPHQTQDQAVPQRARRHQGCSPTSRTDAAASPVAGTVSACPYAGAPTGSRVCQVRKV